MKISDFRVQIGATLVAAVVTVAAPIGPIDIVARARAQESTDRYKALDEVLDLNVRDGLVYYRTLKAQRGRLDRHISGLAQVSISSAPREEQIAFWINAYNAIVLQTVVDHYPITQRTREYPAAGRPPGQERSIG